MEGKTHPTTKQVRPVPAEPLESLSALLAATVKAVKNAQLVATKPVTAWTTHRERIRGVLMGRPGPQLWSNPRCHLKNTATGLNKFRTTEFKFPQESTGFSPKRIHIFSLELRAQGASFE